MKVFVMTCDAYMDAIPGFAHQFNKYWSPDQEVIVAGFSKPEFDMPDNFTFFSIGDQRNYPVDRWSDALLKLMWHFPKEKHFVLMLEDYWICEPVNVNAVKILHDYMVQFDYVIKMDLCGDRRFAGGVEDYGDVAGIPLVISDYTSAYHMSLMVGIWNQDNLKAIVIPHESPWQVELEGTTRLSRQQDKMVVLGTKIDPWPVKHVLMYRGGDSDNMIWDGLSEEDVVELKGLGYK